MIAKELANILQQNPNSKVYIYDSEGFKVELKKEYIKKADSYETVLQPSYEW